MAEHTPTEADLRTIATYGAVSHANSQGESLDEAAWRAMLDRSLDAIKAQAVVDRDEADRLASVPCRWEMDHWTYFGHGDDYWMKCKLVGPHEVHEDSDTGAKWTNDTEGAHEL